ncbi:hypothetical protein L3Q82_022939 [Scortum barcoo]|uniref:Uncharacterized protein n=1 Tax=Scortum barcoo TaxID=214431 RepID=A0ACB8WXJ3_9TELE|nr:hypothetical protein L3Q82_022939 [Scortum barcoo]
MVGRWKEYFEDLLNPTNTPSTDWSLNWDFEADSSPIITQAEVTEVVRNAPLSGKAPGVDEICPEYLKPLDLVGLSWLTRLCKHCMEGDHTSQPPREGLRQGTGEENSADSQTSDSGGTMRFSSQSWNQLYTLHRVLESLWESNQCFVDLEKAFDHVPRGILCGVLREYGVRSGAFAKHSLVSVQPEQELGSRISGSKSRPVPSACWTPAGLPFVTGSVHNLYGQDFSA